MYEPDSFRPLALVEGNAKKNQKIKTYWYQNDHLGTPHSLTDSLGNLVYSCRYNAYGKLQKETQHRQEEFGVRVETNLRFQGQYWDEETGLHYNFNRYYDPALGRYLTQDPIKLGGGLNSYQYVGGNPVRWIDPYGLTKGIDQKIAILSELEPVDNLMYGARVGEGLPGTPGIAIPRRPTPKELELLSEKHRVEFAVTYKYGPGKNGGGGQYYLHSGVEDAVGFPLEADRMFIYHTHPGIGFDSSNAFRSRPDMEILMTLRLYGSPQRSSQVVPTDKAVTRFSEYESNYRPGGKK